MNFRQSVTIPELWRPEVAIKDVEKIANFARFLEKRRLMGKFSKFCSERIHRDADRRVLFKFRESLPTGNR